VPKNETARSGNQPCEPIKNSLPDQKQPSINIPDCEAAQERLCRDLARRISAPIDVLRAHVRASGRTPR
jgi:hypothetical protein